MPTNILNKTTPVAATWTQAYELGSNPAVAYGVVNVRVLNTDSVDNTVSIAVGTVATGQDPAVKDIVISKKVLTASQVYELTNLVLRTGEGVFIKATSDQAEVRVDGLGFNTTTNLVASGNTEVATANTFYPVQITTVPAGQDPNNYEPKNTIGDDTHSVFGTVNIYITNTAAASRNVTMNIGVLPAPPNPQTLAATDMVEDAVALAPDETLIRSCIIMAPNERVEVSDSLGTGDLSVRVSGIIHLVPPAGP